MSTQAVSKQIIIRQFLTWWGLFLLFFAALMAWRIAAGREKDLPLSLIIATFECTAMGSFMAVSHYYGLYERYFLKRKYGLYLILFSCFICAFILLDAFLFCLQIGITRYFSDGLSHALFIDFERVAIAYMPVALIYTISRNIQYGRKQRRMAKFAERIA